MMGHQANTHTEMLSGVQASREQCWRPTLQDALTLRPVRALRTAGPPTGSTVPRIHKVAKAPAHPCQA